MRLGGRRRVLDKGAEMRTLLAICLSLALISGCGPTITSGTITDLKHHDEYRYTTTTYIKSGNILIPITSYHTVPESWEVEFEGADEKGKIVRRSVDVEHRRFRHLEMGAPFNMNLAESGQ